MTLRLTVPSERSVGLKCQLSRSLRPSPLLDSEVLSLQSERPTLLEEAPSLQPERLLVCWLDGISDVVNP